MFITTFIFFLIFSSFNQLRIKNDSLDKKWIDHKTKYGLKFPDIEDDRRKEIFRENYEFIQNSNARNINFTLQMNSFGHLEQHEKPRMLNLRKGLELYGNINPIFIGQEIPSEHDWRKYKIVSPVENQYSCGCCYAFSAIGAIESQFALHKEDFVSLSKQEIVDCSSSFGNTGCYGGSPVAVYQYCKENGIKTSSEYPYYGKKYSCTRNNPSSFYKIRGYKFLTAGDEDNLLRALYNIGPISISIDADHREFDYYSSGIIDLPSCNSKHLTHAVLAVGYSLKPTPYLLVKNSRGKHWGIDGYFKIALKRNNMCGISSSATYPIVVDSYDKQKYN